MTTITGEDSEGGTFLLSVQDKIGNDLWSGNKLASIETTLVQNYNPPID